MPITNNNQPVPAVLREIASGYPLQRRHAVRIMPIWQPIIAKDTYKVAQFSKGYLKPEDFKRGMGSEAKRYTESVEGYTDIICKRYTIEAAVDWAETHGAEDIVRATILTQEARLKNAMEKLYNSIEAEQIALLTDPAAYQGNTEALSGTDMWDDPACDVIASVMRYKQAIKDSVGIYPNQITISEPVWNKIKTKKNLLEKLPSTSLQSGLTPETFAALAGIPEVIIGDTMLAGASGLNYPWGKNAVLSYNKPNIIDPSLDPVFGLTIMRPLGYDEVRSYADEKRTSDVVAADIFLGWGLISPKAGFLLQNTIA